MNLNLNNAKKLWINILEQIQFGPKLLFTLLVFSSISIVTILLSSNIRNQLILLELPHNGLLDFFYVLLDPIIIWVLTAYWAFQKLLNLIIPKQYFSSKIKMLIAKFSIVVIVLGFSIFGLYFIENQLIKPIFHKLRPYEQYQHMILHDVLLDKHEDIKNKVDISDFSCKLAITYLGAQDKTLGSSLEKERKEILSGIGMYNTNLTLEEKISHLKNIKQWLDKNNDLLLSQFIENTRDYSCERYDSCPSGTILRQVFVFFLALLIYTQPVAKKDKLFETGVKFKNRLDIGFVKNNWKYFSGSLFLSTNLLALLIVFLSRMYGYRHNALEEVISLTTALGFALLAFLFLYYQVVFLKDRAKEDFMDNLPLAVFELSHSRGTILRCNESLIQLFGHTEKENAVGRKFQEYWVNKNQLGFFYSIIKNTNDYKIRNFIANLTYPKSSKKNGSFFARVDAAFISEQGNEYIRGVIAEISEYYDRFNLGFFQTNPNGAITFCNLSFCNMLGYSDIESVVGKKLRDIIKFQKGFDINELADGEYFGLNIKNKDNPKLEKKINLYSHALSYYSDNAVHGYEGVIWDISDTEDLWNISFTPIYIIQEKEPNQFYFSFVNQAFLDLFGYSKDELTQLEVQDLVSKTNPAKYESWFDSMKRKLREEVSDIENEKIELEYIRKDKSIFQGESLSRSIKKYHGSQALFGHIRSLEEQRKEEFWNQQEILASYGLFMMHRIKNPLSVISAHVSLLTDFKSRYINNAELYSDALTKINETTDEISNLTVAAMQNIKDSQKDAIEVDLILSASKAISLVQKRIDEKKVSVKINESEEFMRFIRCNEYSSVQIFFHLISNSLDHIDENGNIELTFWSDDSYIHIKVSDDGHGFSKDIQDLSLIFSDAFTTHVKGHAGLGLSFIFRKVTELHGTVRPLRNKPKGAIFEIILPIIKKGV